MKKYLSVVLAVLMLLSLSAFAAPVAVGSAETAKEAVIDVTEAFEAEIAEETADLQAESEYGRLIYTLDLEPKTTNGVAYNGGEVPKGWNTWQQVPKNSSYYDFTGFDTQMYFENYNSNDTLSVVDDGTGNHVFKFDAHYKWSRLNLIAGGSASYYPAGDYTLVYDIWVDENYDWTASHVSQVSTSIAFSSTTEATILSKSSDFTLKSGTNKLTNTIRFRTVADKTNRFQIMQDTAWNTANTNLTVTNHVSNLTFNYYLDNVKLYYQGPATVTFSSPVEATVPEAITNVLPGTKLDLSAYKATATDETKVFQGWSLTEGGAIVNEVEVLKDTTIYAVYREAISVSHDEYGQLVYWLDFDGVTIENNKNRPYYSVTSKVMVAPDNMPDASTLSFISHNTEHACDVKDGYFSFGGGYPRTYITTSQSNPFPEGRYTVVWSAYAGQDNLVTNSLSVNGTDETKWSTEAAPIASKSTNLTTKATEHTASFTYSNRTVVGATNTHSDIELGKIGIYNSLATVNTENRKIIRYIDYIKVYYSPLVDITFDANGKDVSVPEKIIGSTLFNPAQQPVCEDVGTARFAGWSEAPDGEIITSSKAFSKDTTLYAIWDENYYASEDELEAGEFVFGFNYNNMKSLTNHHSNIYAYGTTVGKSFDDVFYSGARPGEGQGPWLQPGEVYVDKQEYQYGFKYGEYGVGGSYNHPDNAYVINQKLAAGEKKHPKVYLPGDTGGGVLKDGVYTIYVEFSVKEARNVSIEYNGFVTVFKKGEATVSDVSFGTQAAEFDGNTYYIKRTIFVKDGYIGSLDSDNLYEITKATSKIGFNFSVSTVDDENEGYARIECDNFKIYYKEYDYSPMSEKESSIRISDPCGIRFKASVSELERNNESVTEYGFIVAREAALKEAGITPEEFTDKSKVKLLKGATYGVVDGQEVDMVFEKKQGRTYFAAVVYNIPAANYADNLVVKPYLVKDGVTVYGTAIVNNIEAVAKALRNSDDYEQYREIVDKILEGKQV